MLEIIVLLGYFVYRNGMRAKQKEENIIVWGLLTVLAFFVATIIGFYVVIFTFCKNIINVNQFATMDPKAQEALQQQLVKVLSDNPLHLATIYVFGVGGYLLIRYLLERKPGKKKPEVHWMDRINDQP